MMSQGAQAKNVFVACCQHDATPKGDEGGESCECVCRDCKRKNGSPTGSLRNAHFVAVSLCSLKPSGGQRQSSAMGNPSSSKILIHRVQEGIYTINAVLMKIYRCLIFWIKLTNEQTNNPFQTMFNSCGSARPLRMTQQPQPNFSSKLLTESYSQSHPRAVLRKG
jgi:hypothetical protein